jgi:ribose 5-phosphate isomerase
MPGVIDHGIFVEEADEILIEKASGEIERLTRSV